ncbi:hypothetical protein ACUOA8_61035, partial [Escherichia sp. SS-MK2]
IADGKLHIVQEGRVNKFIRELPEITFSGKIALERGLDVRYITERAVFTLKVISGSSRINLFTRPSWTICNLPSA